MAAQQRGNNIPRSSSRIWYGCLVHMGSFSVVNGRSSSVVLGPDSGVATMISADASASSARPASSKVILMAVMGGGRNVE